MAFGFLPRPTYSDFAEQDYPTDEWQHRTAVYERCDYYYEGTVFQKLSGAPSKEDGKAPLLYPLKVNLVAAYCKLHAHALFGAYDGSPVEWEAKEKSLSDFRQPGRDGQEAAAQKAAREARDRVVEVWEESGQDTLLLEQALTMQRYGGCVFGLRIDPSKRYGLCIYSVHPASFFPRWSPLDADDLLEVIISYPIKRATANLMYGLSLPGSTPEVLYQEHWTKDAVVITAGEQEIRSEPNVLGFIPFEYVPRVRSAGEFYGESLIWDIFGLQDELNLRLADVGDRINYTAHPIYVVKNFRGNKKALEIGPDGIVNLGMGTGDLDPDMKVLAPPGEPAGTFNYMEMMVDLSRMMTFSPPVAFGEDEGSQRSSLTLSMRMWPLLQQTRTARTHLSQGLMRLNKKILRARRIRDEAERREPAVTDRHLDHEIVPVYQPLMPRDRLDIVNEVVQRWNIDKGNRPLITIEEAYEMLGHEKPEEMAKAVMALHKQMAELTKEMQPEPAPFGGGRPQPVKKEE